MCGGSKGPSSEELIAQENAARARAEAELKLQEAEKQKEKDAENARIVSEQAAAANQDAARRAANRTLLAGLEEEEGLEQEDPDSQSTAKRKRASALNGLT